MEVSGQPGGKEVPVPTEEKARCTPGLGISEKRKSLAVVGNLTADPPAHGAVPPHTPPWDSNPQSQQASGRDLRLRPRGHWGRLSSSLLSKNINIKINITIILPGVWYGYETWSLTLTEERMIGVFENKVIRKVFVSEKEEVRG